MTVAALIVAAVLAALLAHVGTPVAIAAAKATGFLDRPTGALKAHAEATPYLGGMAVFVPFLTASALVFELERAFLGVLLAATLAALLGLMDDFGAMRPGVKLLGQMVIVLVLVRADVRIGIEILPAWLNLTLTALWLLTVINAVNFLDILDGLAASTSLAAAAALLLLALVTGNLPMASLCAVLVGSLSGYLRFSLPRARIFLGDAGSLFLGTTLASLALAIDYTRLSAWALAAPLLVLAVPLFEILSTVVFRVAGRQAPWRGSPDHVALRLRRLGLSVSQVVVVLTAAAVAAGCLATWLVVLPLPAAPAIIGGSGLAALACFAVIARAPAPKPKA